MKTSCTLIFMHIKWFYLRMLIFMNLDHVGQTKCALGSMEILRKVVSYDGDNLFASSHHLNHIFPALLGDCHKPQKYESGHY